MAYTQEELDAALSKIVRTSVRFGYDSLGTRKVGTSFNDLQDAAAGVFVSFPNAPYYVVRLGADRLVDYIATEAAFLGEFISTVRAVGRNVSPVRKLSSLTNARVALDALATATGQRAGAFVEIEDIPAFQRFDSNTQRFLDIDGKNVRSGGDVVPTPEQARGQLASLAQDLQAQHSTLIDRVTFLKDSISDYETLDLPERLSRDIIANARDVLQSRIEELEGLSPPDQLALLRDVVLDVLAARATVRGFGSLSPQGLFIPVTGSAGPFASSALPATVAALQADLQGPYAVFTGQDRLTLEVEGDQLELQLPGSFVPFLQVAARGPFEVFAGANEFDITVTGSSPLTVTLSNLSPTLTDPWDIVDDINAAVTTEPIEAVVDFIPVKTSQPVDIDVTGSGGDADFILPVAFGTWASLGVVIGDRILVKDSTSTNNDGDLYVIDSFPDAQTAECSIVRVLGTPADETDKVVEVGTDAAIVWTVQVPLANAQTALDNRWSLRLDDVEDGTLNNIGLFSGSEVFAQKTTAEAIADNVNTSLSASLLGSPRVTAVATFVEDFNTLSHTNTDNTLLTVYAFRGSGEITVSGGGSATFELPTLAGELGIGDILVIREHDDTIEIGKVGTISSVVGTTVVATFGTPPALDTDVLIDAGPDRTTSVGRTARIAENSLQDGDYLLDEAVNGLDFVIDRILVFNADVGGQPYFLTAVSVGSSRIDFLSQDQTLSTSVQVIAGTDDVSGELYTTVPKLVVGTTPYFQLPETPSNLEPGDVVELHNNEVAAPDIVRTIKQVFSDNVIELEIPIDVTQPALLFTTGSPVPFGRIRKQVKQNFDELEAALELWLALDTNDLLGYFRELDGLLNALINNRNPTPVQVNDAVFHLQELFGTLTIAAATSTGKSTGTTIEFALNAYEASVVSQVDNLITSYEQKGADRAKELLLQGQFSVFFGLDQDGLSYAGEAQRLMKEVARMDLPVRKDTRHTLEALVQDTEVASWDDTDFEYTEEDIDPADRVEIPGEGDLAPNIPVP